MNKHQPVRAWVVLTALLLAGLWLPITSHDWLESVGWIHAHGDSVGDAPHDVADGLCRLENSAVLLKAPTLAALPSVQVFIVALLSAVVESRFAPVTAVFQSTAPPGLVVTWQFSHRTAYPNQAPPALG